MKNKNMKVYFDPVYNTNENLMTETKYALICSHGKYKHNIDNSFIQKVMTVNECMNSRANILKYV